jgi:uncharacterized protein (TIGR03437 family)
MTAQPAVADGGVLNAATYAKGQAVTLGSFVAIFGSGFGNGGVATGAPWPTNLGGTSVTMNGIPVPLYAVTDGQINAQVPFEALPAGQTSGSVNIIVQRGGQNSPVKSFQVAPFGPGIFSIAGTGQGLANAISPDGALAAPAGAIPQYASHPATPGGTIIVLATGLGATDNAIPSGNASSDALRRNTTLPVVTVGGIPAQVVFSGLSPQFPAVNQLNIVLPVGVPSGSAVPIQISLGGVLTSALLNIAIASGPTATLSSVTTLLTPASQPKSLVVYGNLAYLCGTAYNSVLDISDPSNPKLAATFGNNVFNVGGVASCYVENGTLIEVADNGSGMGVASFSLANPAKPALLSQASATNKTFLAAVAHRGSSIFASSNFITFSGSTFLNQGGDVTSIDVSNLGSPRAVNALSGNTGSGGGPNIFFDLIAVNDTTAYASSSSSVGNATATGNGLLAVIDTSDPTSLKQVKQVAVSGTRQGYALRSQGNLAVMINDIEGWRNPIDFSQGALVGPINISTFDITDPRNPVLVTTVASSVGPATSGGGGVPIGTGQFAFGGTRSGQQNQLLVVDARNAQAPASTTLPTPDVLHAVFVVPPNYLYALVDNTGIMVYRISN